MDVRAIQSQSLYASVALTGTASQSKQTGVLKSATPTAAQAVDVVEVSLQVDASFVSGVVQKSLEDRLKETLSQAGIDIASLTGGEPMDFSPQATANRIVEFSVSFFAAYSANHADAGDEDRLQGFVDLVKGAVEEGFSGARDLLNGFAEMTEEMWTDVEETYSLTMKGIDEFAEKQRQLGAAPMRPEVTGVV